MSALGLPSSDQLVTPRTELRHVLRVRYERTEGPFLEGVPEIQSAGAAEAIASLSRSCDPLAGVDDDMEGTVKVRAASPEHRRLSLAGLAEVEDVDVDMSSIPPVGTSNSRDPDEVELLDLTRRISLTEASLGSTRSVITKLAAGFSEEEPEAEGWSSRTERRSLLGRCSGGPSRCGGQRSEEHPGGTLPGQLSPGSDGEALGRPPVEPWLPDFEGTKRALHFEGTKRALAQVELSARRHVPRACDGGSDTTGSPMRNIEELQRELDAVRRDLELARLRADAAEEGSRGLLVSNQRLDEELRCCRSDLQIARRRAEVAAESSCALQTSNQKLQEELRKEKLKVAEFEQTAATSADKASAVHEHLKREMRRLSSENARIASLEAEVALLQDRLEEHDAQEAQAQLPRGSGSGSASSEHEVEAEVLEFFKALEPCLTARESATGPTQQAIFDRLLHLRKQASTAKLFVSEAHTPLQKALELCQRLGKGEGAPPLFDPKAADVTSNLKRMLELLKFISGVLDEVAMPRRACVFQNNWPGCGGR